MQKTEKIEEKLENDSNLIQVNNKIVDKETGEVLSELEIEKSFDKHTMYVLYSLFEGKLEMQ